MLSRFFDLEGRRTTVGTELRAGVVTFLTMAYILFVNPQILAQAGMPAADVVTATALAAALATFVMGLWAKLPFALAPGMGLNAYFTFGVVGALGVTWQVALAAVFVEGVLFLLLSLTGVRAALLDAIPRSLKLATMSGIGLFLAIIGLESSGVVVDDPATLVSLGDLGDPTLLLALAGVLVVAVLMARGVRGAILYGIATIALTAWVSGLAPAPAGLWTVPGWPSETALALDFRGLLAGKMVAVVFAFLFVDLLDTAGTLVGVGQLTGLVDRRGHFPEAGRAFVADACGTTCGALLGTSTVTTYIESATGVEEGGRSGLTAVFTGILFLLSPLFTPVLVAVPAFATAPALLVVGALMMRGAAEVDWTRADVAIPAFLTVAVMPFTYSIANGLAAGIVAYVTIRLLTGRPREIGWVLGGLAASLVLFYALLRAG